MFALSKKRVRSALEDSGRRVWPRQDILAFIDENLPAWQTDKETPNAIEVATHSLTVVLNAIVKSRLLTSVTFKFPYRSVTRFKFGEVPKFELIQAVDSQGYFSHYTAMQMNGLTEQIPKSVYFNVEQPATGGGGSLSQAGINRAFKGKCRVTTNVLEFDELSIHKINGQNTGRLGVVDRELDDGANVQVTNLERTLIDIAVRPIYSGGIAEIANAYRSAAEKVSGNRIATYLNSLNYTYPYHQVIGFYMTRAGNYSKSQMAKLKEMPMDFDFYLDYQIKTPILNKEWRLFVPKGF